MYYLRPDLTVTGYLYRYLSDYIWLKFFSAQMRFPSSNVTIGVRPQHIFPDGFAPDSRCSGASFYGQKRSADTVGRGPPEKLQSGTLPKNFKFTAISIIQWPALGRQLLMKGRRLGKNEEGILCPGQLPLLTMTK